MVADYRDMANNFRWTWWWPRTESEGYTYFSNDDTDENVGAEMIADMKPNDDAGTGENVGAKMIADVKPNDDAGENVGAKMIADVSEWLLPVVSIPVLLYIFN